MVSITHIQHKWKVLYEPVHLSIISALVAETIKHTNIESA